MGNPITEVSSAETIDILSAIEQFLGDTLLELNDYTAQQVDDKRLE